MRRAGRVALVVLAVAGIAAAAAGLVYASLGFVALGAWHRVPALWAPLGDALRDIRPAPTAAQVEQREPAATGGDVPADAATGVVFEAEHDENGAAT